MSEHKEPIPSMIYNAAVGGHVTNSQQIIDENENKEQSQINSEVKNDINVEKQRAQGVESEHNTRINNLEDAVGSGGSVDSRISNAVATETTRAQTAEEQLRTLYNNLQQSQPIPVTSLPATGEEGKIYRLAGTTSYSDYMWNDSQFVKMAEYNNAIEGGPIKDSGNIVSSGGLFDIVGGDIVPGSLTKYNGFINGSNKWQTSSTYKYCLIPIKEGNVFLIKANPSSSTNIAYLKNEETSIVSDTTPSFIDDGRHTILEAEEYMAIVPKGANYLYVSAGTNGNQLPQTIFKYQDIANDFGNSPIIPASQSLVSGGNRIYVSSSLGNDNNNGSEKFPFATISAAMSSLDRTQKNIIFLKSGDIFYETITTGEQVSLTIKPYGIGATPVVCGYKYIKTSAIVATSTPNVYSIDITDPNNFIGFITVNAGNDKFAHLIDNKTGKLYCRSVGSSSALAENFDVYHEVASEPVLMYYNGDVTELDIAIAVQENGVRMAWNAEIDNIHFKGWGRHGAYIFSNNNTIDGCIFENIGGHSPNGLGNGIEIYADKTISDVSIRNCTIENVYDSGTSIQNWTAAANKVINICFENNLIINALWGYEGALNGSLPSSGDIIENVSVKNNKIIFVEYPFVNSDRSSISCFIKYAQNYKEGYTQFPTIENNVFAGDASLIYDSSGVYPIIKMQGNKAFLTSNKYLLTKGVSQSEIENIPVSDVESYNEEVEKNTQIVVLSSEYDINLLYL